MYNNVPTVNNIVLYIAKRVGLKCYRCKHKTK